MSEPTNDEWAEVVRRMLEAYEPTERERYGDYLHAGRKEASEEARALLARHDAHKGEQVEYRMFDPAKEPIQEGDQFCNGFKDWVPYRSHLFGSTLTGARKSRRPIRKDQP